MSHEQHSPQDVVMARILDELSDSDVRISRIMETIESEYVRTPNDDVVESEVRLLVRATTRKTRDGHVLIFTGESGAGKSTTIHHHLDKYKSLQPSLDKYGDTLMPLIRVKAPSDCTMRDLGLEMLGKMDYQVKREIAETAVYRYVRERLKLLGTKVVFIDEFQHVLDAPTVKGVRHLTDQLKNLLQEEGNPIYVIVAGLPEIASVVHRDPKEQMEGRTVVWRFPDLSFESDGEFLIAVIRHYASLARLELAVEPTSEFVMQMLHAGRNRLGIIMRIIMFAVEDALDRGDSVIANEHWVRAYHRLAKRGRNVFADSEWWTIRRSVMRDGTLGPEGIEDQPKPPRARSAKRKT